MGGYDSIHEDYQPIYNINVAIDGGYKYGSCIFGFAALLYRHN